MQLHWRFAKNAISNLGRGGASAVVAVLLPPVLVRHMAPASYAVWILVLQTAAYVGYLNFGLQTAIGRYVAYANEKKDIELRDSVFSTALAGLFGAGLLSLAGLMVAVWIVPFIFPSIPGELISQMRLALWLVGFSLAVDLPASACNGVFIGLERYEIPALITGSARLASAFGLIVAALAGWSLIAMAAIVALANLLSSSAQYIALRRVVPELRFQHALVRRSTIRELSGYCYGLTIVSFSMLLVTGFDLVLVGHFEFAAVTPYSVAASLIALISGLLYAIVNVILPHAAILHAREKAEEVGKLVISATRISVLLLVLSGIPIFLYAAPIIRLWIGPGYVASGTVLLAILVVANMIRLVGAPYAIVMIAAGQHRYLKVSPLAEGVSNFVLSVILGFFYGAVGVALGTLLGSIISVASHLGYSMPRTNVAIRFSRRKFVVSGVLVPLLCTWPLLLAAVAASRGIELPPLAIILAALLSAMGAGLLILRTQRAGRAVFSAPATLPSP
jgi:O-antigen/teichoic acid export membrane protein